MQYLCISCFSQERTLFVVTEECLALLNSCVTTPGKELLTTLTQRENLKLCWECQHHLKRFSRLIKNIEQNAEVLVNNTSFWLQCMSSLSIASVEVYEIERKEITFDSSKEKEGDGLYIEEPLCVKDELNNGLENRNVKKEQHSSEITVEEDNFYKEELYCNFDEVDQFNDSDFEALTVIDEKNLPELQQRKEDKTKVEPDKEVTKQKKEQHSSEITVEEDNCFKEELYCNFDEVDHFNDSDNEALTVIDEKNPPEVQKRKEDKKKVKPDKKVTKQKSSVKDHNPLLERYKYKTHTEEEVMSAIEEKKLNVPQHVKVCNDCGDHFDSDALYLKHVKTKHDEQIGQYQCKMCKMRFATKGNFNCHKRLHFVTFVCDVCAFECKRRERMTNHLKNVHAQYSCDNCERTFDTQTEMKTHRTTCYTCPTCKTVCKSRYYWKEHCRRHNVAEGESDMTYCGICQSYVKTKWFTQHLQTSLRHIDRDSFRFVCSVCGEKLPTSSRLTIHMFTKHKIGKARYACAHCPKSYMARKLLARHLSRAHGMGDYRPPKRKVCEVCGKLFESNTILRSHMNTHSGARPFQCRYCARAFSNHGAYYTHNRVVHRKRVLKDGDYDDHSPLSQCPTCNKSFGTKSKLARHVAKAHGPAAADTTHQCLSCDKSFTTANSLQCHYSSKHGGAPLAREHACHLCPKTFSTPALKRQHVKRHIQPTDRVYRCKSCDKTFNHTGALYLHYKLKHLRLKRWQKVKIQNLYTDQEIVVTYDEEGTNKVGQ